MLRVLVAGYYGQGNAGDEAILEGISRDIGARVPGVEFTIAAGTDRSEPSSSRVALTDIPALVDAVLASDLIVLGGGGLLQDYWPASTDTILSARQGGLAAYTSIPVLASLAGRPLMVYAAGVGPVRTEEGRQQVRLCLQLASAATVRDEDSLEVLRELGVATLPNGAVVEVAADPASGIVPVGGGLVDDALAAVGLDPAAAVSAVVLRPWAFGPHPAQWQAEVAAGLEPLFEQGHQVLLVPFQRGGDDDDLALCRDVAAAVPYPSRVHVLDLPAEPALLAAVLQRCQVVVAMRYHAAMFAAQGGVPVVGLAYDPKVRALLTSTGLSEAVLVPERWTARHIAEAIGRAQAVEHSELRSAYRRWAATADRSADLAAQLLTQPSVVGDGRLTAARLALGRVREAGTLQERLAAAQAEQSTHTRAWGLTEAALAQLREVQDGLRDSVLAAERVADELQLELETTRRERDTALGALAETAEALRAAEDAQQEVVDTRIERLQREVAESSNARELAEERRRSVEADMRLVTSSPAYRLARPVWRTGNALMPLGSRRRAAYRRAQQALVRPPDAAASPGASSGTDADVDRCLLELRSFLTADESTDVPLVLVLAGTQLLENEGQRPTHLALRMAASGCRVVFAYWRWGRDEWVQQDRLDQGIFQVPVDVVVDHPSAMADGPGAAASRMVLVTFPYPGFFELLARLDGAGWYVVYDVMDDWEEFHRVGQADWFDRSFEAHLAARSDVVTAINTPLAALVESWSGRAVHVVPNGVRAGIEHVRTTMPLQRGALTIGYFGHLTPAWFDWRLVVAAAERRPDWRWYLIGYGGESPVALPPNVVLLGRRPQSELAALADNWDVAVVPFLEHRLSTGADPIKTYEYLSMGLPVVVSGVHPPLGAEDLVRRVRGVEELVEALEAVAKDGGPERGEQRRVFAASATWDSRVASLLALVSGDADGAVLKRFLLDGRGAP